MKSSVRVKVTFVLIAASLTLTVPSGLPVRAEQSGKAGVVVSFAGSYSPNHLPRQRLVPIRLFLEGSARAGNATPPRLRRIELAFGARGGLDVKGLPTCARSQLRNATQRQALDRCRPALIGRGEIVAEVPFSEEEPIAVHAGLLAFNGRHQGAPAAWVHAYSVSPPASFVLPFYLARPPQGTYGVLMSSPVGRALGRWPRLRSFAITLGRRYRADGQTRSYLSAHCPLPPRFHGLPVPFARATYEFAFGPTIIQPIQRKCVVRR